MSFDNTRIGRLLDDAVERRVMPGVAVIITDRDEVLYHGTAGTLSLDGGAPVSDDTMFRYASTTKALASIAALQLIEQGRLGLDDEVASVLPEFARLQVLDGFDGDRPILRPPARQATIRELLTHSSGLAYFFLHSRLTRFHELTGIPHPLTGLRASLADVPLVHDPGTVWEYGTSTDWLGLVVEAVSGQGLDAYLAEHIFEPLGITEMTFQPTDEQRARMMAIYGRTPDGGLAPVPLDLPPAPDWWAGGHGLFGTAGAYGRVIRALLRGGELDGERILREDTVELAFSDQLAGVPMPAAGLTSAAPELSNDVPPLPFRQSWGLGFHLVLEDVPGARRAGTGDWAGLFNLYYWIDRTSGIGGMILTQVLPFFDQAIVELFAAIEADTYAQLGAPAVT